MLNESLTKYSNTFRALCELINNSLQARSKNINLDFEYGNQDNLEPFIKSITVSDDGDGVSASEFDNKILEVATVSKDGGEGIGRFGALQIGSYIEIETVAFDKAINKSTKVVFPLDVETLKRSRLEEKEFDVEVTELPKINNSYYQIKIKNLYHSVSGKVPKKQKLTEDFKYENIRSSIFQHYPFHIFNKNVKFSINGSPLKREDFIDGTPISESEPYITKQGVDKDVTILYYKIKSPLNKVKVFFCINNAGIQTPAYEFTYSSDWHTPDLGTWFIYIESDLFTSDLFRNIDVEEWSAGELDDVKAFLKDKINAFFKARNQRFEKFINKFEEDKANPLKDKKSSSPSQEILFKKAAFLIEDEYHLLEKQDKIREVVYPLLDHAIANGQIRSIFESIVKLSPENINKLHSLLEKTDLENIIHFTTVVAEKKEFLDFLYEIVYGDLSKVLRERSQLHKIIEKELWLFGEQYSNTPALWSDKKIGNILNEIRQKHFNYEPTEDDENLIKNDDAVGVDDITDLFFYNEKIGDNEVKEIVIVELKSPKCAISQKELNQIDRYAFTLEQHNGLPKDKVKYKIFLISSKLTDFAKSKMASAYKKYGVPFLFDKKEGKEIELFVMEWNEIIESNKRKLQYLSNNLAIKEREVRDKFEEEYPEIINEKVKATMRRSKESIT